MNKIKQTNTIVERTLTGLACLLALSAAPIGCRAPDAPARAVIIDNNPSSDPSNANFASAANQPSGQPVPAQRPAAGKVRVLAAQQSLTPQQTTEQYADQNQQQPYAGPPPADPQYSNAQTQPYTNNNDYDPTESAGYEALAEATQPPPPLPEYEQPPVPEPNDLWTPGYWNYAPQGYYWVPGAWVAPPFIGALWTPAYWGYEGNRYRLHRGFWARHIGFYGGINYGYGYTGSGYQGGYWNGNNFFYNRAVNRINVTNIHNVYEHNVVVNNVTRISYNGGNGLRVRPAPQELAVYREQRLPPMATQVQLREESARNRQQFFNDNHGRPAQPFVTRPVAAERNLQPLPNQPGQQLRPDQRFDDRNQRAQQIQQQQIQQRTQEQHNQEQRIQQQQAQQQQNQQRFQDQRAQQQRLQEQQNQQQHFQDQRAQQQRLQDQQTQQQQNQQRFQDQRIQQQRLQDQQTQQQQNQQRFQDQRAQQQRLQVQQNQQQQSQQQRLQEQQQRNQEQRSNQEQQQRNLQSPPQRSLQAQPAPRSMVPIDRPGATTPTPQQPRTEPQSRPQPQPQPQAQPHPQSQTPHQQPAPRSEPPHSGRPN